MRVGIYGDPFAGWQGGIDLIATIAEGLNAVGVETYLFTQKNICIGSTTADSCQENRCKLIETFLLCVPETKIITTKGVNIKGHQRKSKKLSNIILYHYIKKNNIDVIIPVNGVMDDWFGIPWIGYIYDFQHKYYKEYFKQPIIDERNRDFDLRIAKSKALIVNSEAVRNDIVKFYPEYKKPIYKLPYFPFQRIEIKEFEDIDKYNLPGKFYLISNQFWKHKNHLMAFEALEKAYSQGVTDLHIVCTGEILDNRFPEYGKEVLDKISRMACRRNIHLLGYIPKDEQMLIMSKAIGLIQPTLFEGGPGGGSTSNAICLGLPILISDIPINKEIKFYNKIYYFSKHDSDELANLMIVHMNDCRMDAGDIEKMINRNREAYGHELKNFICDFLDSLDS